jgi:hypothetical protein
MDKKKIMIVIEDIESGIDTDNIQIYLDGDKGRIGRVSNKELSGAEYWASILFEVCANAMRQTGQPYKEEIPTPPRKDNGLH